MDINCRSRSLDYEVSVFLGFSGCFEAFFLNHTADMFDEHFKDVSGSLWQSQHAPKLTRKSKTAVKTIFES